MDGIVAQAARNNALWCDAVCRAHGRPGAFENALWVNRSGTPRYYPDAVTLSEADSPEQLEALTALFATSPTRSWAVKDSFMSLDLAPFGFAPVFDARWITRDPAADDKPASTGWFEMRQESDLIGWERAWAAGDPSWTDTPAARLFKPSLLADPDIVFAALTGNDGAILGGGILNRGAGVVGLSNLFATSVESEAVWHGLGRWAMERFPGLLLVGYEHGEELASARRSGFETIGDLRVWHRAAS